MNITIKIAYDLIQKCSAIIIDNNALMYPCTAELNGEKDNEWLFLSWTDDEGLEFAIVITEECNPQIVNHQLVLTDNEGTETKLTLLSPMKIEWPITLEEILNQN